MRKSKFSEAQITMALRQAEPDPALEIAQRLGEVTVGGPSVVIAAASAQCESAYRACRTALQRLERKVPIWKREH